MKRITAAIAALTLALSLGACSKPADNDHTPDMQAVADVVGASIDISEMSQIPDEYVSGLMGIAPTSYVMRNTLISAVGTNIDEYGIFQCETEDKADELEDILEDYLDYRESVWMDEYLPDEKPKLDDAEIWTEGCFVVYAILDDADRAAVEKAFTGCFTEG